jgi:hypothetical protein
MQARSWLPLIVVCPDRLLSAATGGALQLAFRNESAEDTNSVAHRTKTRFAVATREFDTWDLSYPQSDKLRSHNDLSLYLESGGSEIEGLEKYPPERKKPIAEIRVAHAEEEVRCLDEGPVTGASDRGDVE